MPNVEIFFRDSQLITAFLLIVTILLRKLIARSSSQRNYLWIQATVSFATSNRVGDFLLAPMAPEINDVDELVESVRKLSTNETICLNFCKLIDRVIFLALSLVYILMASSLLPKGYLTANYDSIESLS